jgi:hypothetical protein
MERNASPGGAFEGFVDIGIRELIHSDANLGLSTGDQVDKVQLFLVIISRRLACKPRCHEGSRCRNRVSLRQPEPPTRTSFSWGCFWIWAVSGQWSAVSVREVQTPEWKKVRAASLEAHSCEEGQALIRPASPTRLYTKIVSFTSFSLVDFDRLDCWRYCPASNHRGHWRRRDQHQAVSNARRIFRISDVSKEKAVSKSRHIYTEYVQHAYTLCARAVHVSACFHREILAFIL